MAEQPRNHDKRRLLIDGTKLADPVSDGIRRYVAGLLQAMSSVAVQYTTDLSVSDRPSL